MVVAAAGKRLGALLELWAEKQGMKFAQYGIEMNCTRWYLQQSERQYCVVRRGARVKDAGCGVP